MKKAGILAGFVPLIVYGLLAGGFPGNVVIAPGAALIATVITGFSDLRKGMILSWATLVLFGSLLIAVGVLGMTGIIPVTGILIYAALAAVTFGSILAGIPFTLQYARGMVDRALWENPVFIRVNVLMTGAWGGIFLANLVLSCSALMDPDFSRIASPLTYIFLIAGIVFTMWYPGHVRKKYSSPPDTEGHRGKAPPRSPPPS